MAQYQLVSQISRGATYPTSTSVSASSNCGTLIAIIDSTFTEQMLCELPALNITIYTGTNEVLYDFSVSMKTINDYARGIEALPPYSIPIYDIPQSCVMKVTPLFDNNALKAHNETIACGMYNAEVSDKGVVTDDPTAFLWTTPTDTFPVSIYFDNTNIKSGNSGGGGGGSSQASDVSYDNSLSGLQATNVQDAITELAEETSPIDPAVTETSTNPVESSGIYDFVNSSVATNTAYFIGTFDSESALQLNSNDVTNNDYAFVSSQYTLLASAPSDWNTNYNEYYHVLSVDAPTFVNGKFYEASGSSYVMLDAEPGDWLLNFANYFTKIAGTESYVPVIGITTYEKNEYTTAPQFVENTYYAHSGTYYSRYKYSDVQCNWVFEYTLNNSSFTALQWDSIQSGITATDVTNLHNHIANTNNPHSVTKSQVGLGNVDNTSDLNKPISTATQNALNNKIDTAGTGLSASGTTLNHTNSVSAQTSEIWGSIAYDSTGHITGMTEATQTQSDAINSGATSTKVANIANNSSVIVDLIDNGPKNKISVNSGTTPAGAGYLCEDLPITLPPGDYVWTMTRTGNTDTSFRVKDANGNSLYNVTRGAGVNDIVQDFTISETGATVSIYVGYSITCSNCMVCSKEAYTLSTKYVPYCVHINEKADMSMFDPISESAYGQLTTYTQPLYFIYEDTNM